MLTCKKCGSKMSGVDIVCKHCGTPWGKEGKSKTPIFAYCSIVLAVALGILYYTNPVLINRFIYFVDNNVLSSLKKESQKELPLQEQTPESTNINETEKTPNVATPPDETKNTLEEQIYNLPQEVKFPPVFSSISASSSLSSQGAFSYSPSLLIDGNNSTAWLEGVAGNGINEWILFSSDNIQCVSGIKILNGYQKNKITYANNGKLKKVRFDFSDGTSIEKNLPAQSFEESLTGIDILFDSAIETKSLKITILDIYKGVYYSDTAVNEITIY